MSERLYPTSPLGIRTPLKALAVSFGVETDFAGLTVEQRLQAFAGLGALVRTHKVVVIRNAALDRAQFQRAAELLGQPLRYPFSQGVEGFPALIEIRRQPQQQTAMSTLWHSDSTYLAEPPDFTLLYGADIPPIGGNTVFADTVAAMQHLSPALQAQLRQLRVVQRSDVHAGNERQAHLSMPDTPPAALSATHPAVVSSDGVEAIYVSEEHTSHFDGMTRAESLPMIEFLSRHVAADRFRLQVNWSADTLVVHDNRKTIHRAVDNYYGMARTLWRIIVAARAERVEGTAAQELVAA